MGAEEVLLKYARFSPKVIPEELLSGDIDKREGEILLEGKRQDDLNGAVRRRLIADINNYFFENPKDVDDTRLVFELVEKGSQYHEDKKGDAYLVIKVSVELAHYRPEGCCCC
ncbi:MAG: hypothetical protein QW275_00155 [Candidatus Anstonellaceae archaeon]